MQVQDAAPAKAALESHGCRPSSQLGRAPRGPGVSHLHGVLHRGAPETQTLTLRAHHLQTVLGETPCKQH